MTAAQPPTPCRKTAAASPLTLVTATAVATATATTAPTATIPTAVAVIVAATAANVGRHDGMAMPAEGRRSPLRLPLPAAAAQAVHGRLRQPRQPPQPRRRRHCCGGGATPRTAVDCTLATVGRAAARAVCGEDAACG